MDRPGPGLAGSWRKSSYSQPSDSHCVEVGAFSPGTVSVRDSKDPEGPSLTFSAAEWTAFVPLAIEVPV
jgi:hypothetical protein